MALPVVEYFNVDEQNYSIEIPVDDRLTFPEDNAVESEAVAQAKATLPDLSLKQPRKVSASVLSAMIAAGITTVRTVEECIRAFTAGFTNIPKANDLNLLTSGGAYADKADYPEAGGRRNLTNMHLAEFFMNSPTPESWLGKVLGPKLGKTWYPCTGLLAGSYGVHFADGIWVAGSSMGEGIWWSMDGKSWTRGTGIPSNAYLAKPNFALGLWEVTEVSTNKIWWSEDGKTWTQGTLPTDSIAYSTPTYANGLWVAGGKPGFLWSIDGKTWTLGTGAIYGQSYSTPTYANGLWVGGSNLGIWWSTDGKTWTQGTGVSGIDVSGTFTNILYEGNWFAVSGSYVYFSFDGKLWNRSTESNYNGQLILQLYYANGLFIICRYSGIWWSIIGRSSWFRGTDVGDSEFANVCYANGLWIAASKTKIWYSTDGLSWSYVPSSYDPGATRPPYYDDPYYANGTWLINGNPDMLHSGVADLGYA